MYNIKQTFLARDNVVAQEKRESWRLDPNQNNRAANLPGDVLLTILEMNSMLDLHFSSTRWDGGQIRCGDPLEDLRNASLTCSSWRALVLEASLLWARAIYIDHFFGEKYGKVAWMEEILRRARISPLWIAGRVQDKVTLHFITILLQEEWHRIQRFDIFIDGQCGTSDDFRELMSQPAPLLRQFSLSFNGKSIHDACPPLALFGDQAPNLSHMDIRNFCIDSRASWLLRLGHLVVHLDSASHLPRMIHVLSNTPSLESLWIALPTEKLKENVRDIRGKRKNLHHLKAIKLVMPTTSASLLLQHVIPSRSCSIYIRSKESTSTQKQLDMKLVVSAKRFIRHASHPLRIEMKISHEKPASTFGIHFIPDSVNHCNQSTIKKAGFFFNYSAPSTAHQRDLSSLINAFSFKELASATITEFQYHQSRAVISSAENSSVINNFAPLVVPGIEVLGVSKLAFILPLFKAYMDQSPQSLVTHVLPHLRSIRLEPQAEGLPVGVYHIHPADTFGDMLVNVSQFQFEHISSDTRILPLD